MNKKEIEELCTKVLAFAGDGCSKCVCDTAILFIDVFWTINSDWTPKNIETWINDARLKKGDDYMLPLPEGYNI